MCICFLLFCFCFCFCLFLFLFFVFCFLFCVFVFLLLVSKLRHGVRGLNLDGGRRRHLVPLAELWPLGATDGAHLGHSLQLESHLVVLLK